MLRDLTERVVIASKGRFDRAVDKRKRAQLDLPAEATATADEFMDATLDLWELAPESATRVGHPAPFPVELPQRLIDLYTWRGDVVLDPFMGSGTTAVAAVRTGRHYLGYDTDEAYAKAARARVAAEVEALPDDEVVLPDTRQRRRRRAAPRCRVHSWPTPRPRRSAASPAGSASTGSPPTPPGTSGWCSSPAAAPSCAPGCAGPTSSSARWARPRCSPAAGHRVLVLTTDLPPARSAPLSALRAARGATLVDAIELGAPGAAARLAVYAAGGVDAPVGDLLPGA